MPATMMISQVTKTHETDLERTIEGQLAQLDPDLELVLLDHPRQTAVRLFIDHPQGVDLGLCERVSQHLADLREEYSVEVSSPGLDRPLTRPEHFKRFLGQRATLRARRGVGGRRNFKGILAGADRDGVTLRTEDGEVTIPHGDIERSNLVPDSPGGVR
jgi:ribosome maturation factor RimP